LIEIVRFLYLACFIRARSTICVFLANGGVDEIHGPEDGRRRRRSVALVDVARAVLVMVIRDFQVWDRAAGVEVCYVGLGVEVLLRDVAVVGCLHPVSVHVSIFSMDPKEIEGLRIVDDNLPIRNPACELKISILIEVCDSIAADPRANSALSLVLQRRIFDGKLLGFGVAATVFKISGI
jgi:hypothetical protein